MKETKNGGKGRKEEAKEESNVEIKRKQNGKKERSQDLLKQTGFSSFLIARTRCILDREPTDSTKS
jgi:hypothetical protein